MKLKVINELVGARIRQLRDQRDLSQEALAELCGFHRTYIGLIERGKRQVSLSAIEVIAQRLAISVSDFFKEIETPAAPRPVSKPPSSPTPTDLGAHVATVRQILIDSKLVDAPGYEALWNSYRRAGGTGPGKNRKSPVHPKRSS